MQKLPGGKAAREAQAKENFPVASWLLPRRMREEARAFYAFARGADDLADEGDRPAEERLRRLEALEAGLASGGDVAAFARPFAALCLAQTDYLAQARELLSAFRQDTWKTRYADMPELREYCRRSARPVGRILLRMAGEPHPDLQAADALCDALQLLNHLQDCGKDYRLCGRVYLPQDTLARHGAAPEDVAGPAMTPGLRRAWEETLATCGALLDRARPLPASLRSHRLRCEIAWIEQCARRLAAKLVHHDPLVKRPHLSGWEKWGCLMRALRR